MRNLDFDVRCVECSFLAFVFVPPTTDFDGILNCLFHLFFCCDDCKCLDYNVSLILMSKLMLETQIIHGCNFPFTWSLSLILCTEF